MENQTAKEKTPHLSFVSRFLLGFLGWFLCISLFLGGVLLIMDKMGPGAIILVPLTVVPILATILAVVLAFLIPVFRAKRVPVSNKGIAFGIITAYLINFVVNLILFKSSDILAIVGSILGWPFYMNWLGDLL